MYLGKFYCNGNLWSGTLLLACAFTHNVCLGLPFLVHPFLQTLFPFNNFFFTFALSEKWWMGKGEKFRYISVAIHSLPCQLTVI
jgi:hypothetical protein